MGPDLKGQIVSPIHFSNAGLAALVGIGPRRPLRLNPGAGRHSDKPGSAWRFPMIAAENTIQEAPSRIKSIPQWIWATTLIVSLVLFAASAWKVQRVWSSASWPTTQGVVDVSDLDFVPISRNASKYKLNLVYQYTVNGQRYEGNRVSFAGRTSYIGRTRTEKGVHRVLKTYPEGTRVTVFYHPSRPGTSVLETTIPSSLVKSMLLGFIMAVLSFVGIWRRWSLQTSHLFQPYDPDKPMTFNRLVLGALGVVVCLAIIWIWWELIKKYAGF